MRNFSKSVLSTQSRRIRDIAFVEVDIILREIRSVNKNARLTQIQAHMQIEFLRYHNGA